MEPLKIFQNFIFIYFSCYSNLPKPLPNFRAMLNNIVRAIMPRVHWSAEELAEGAFIVGGNVTKPLPTHQLSSAASNVTRLVVEGVNKTIMGVIDTLGEVAKDVARDILLPGPQNVPLSPTSGGENGDLSVVPGPRFPTIPPSTPSEVSASLKVVFAINNFS